MYSISLFLKCVLKRGSACIQSLTYVSFLLRSDYFQITTPSYIHVYIYICTYVSQSFNQKVIPNRTHFFINPNQYIQCCSNVQYFVAEKFCLYLLIIRPHSSELLKKSSVSSLANLFSFWPYHRRLLTYGMWRGSLYYSQRDWILEVVPFLFFSTPSCNPRSRFVRLHFSPWKCIGFKRW